MINAIWHYFICSTETGRCSLSSYSVKREWLKLNTNAYLPVKIRTKSQKTKKKQGNENTIRAARSTSEVPSDTARQSSLSQRNLYLRASLLFCFPPTRKFVYNDTGGGFSGFSGRSGRLSGKHREYRGLFRPWLLFFFSYKQIEARERER